MGYLALYRKYRPYLFEDVVGQTHVVRTLVNQINSDRVGHAYLFTGSRGTGKTSIAKIFARAVNCESPVNGSACGMCSHCKSSKEGTNLNIIEMDAASHNGVDNIREINDQVQYTPTNGKYKVYIIDEVHMLSSGAFNALLKTLEEPPAHVIFILATTDPQKIPVTILSRCQRFDFKRLQMNEIVEALKKYCKLEKVAITDDAIHYIASLADGGMRDSLSILEQCISFYYQQEITMENVQYLVGAVDKTILFEMIDSIRGHHTAKVMDLCEAVNVQGRNIRQFAADLLLHCRNLLIIKAASSASILDYSDEHLQKLNAQSNSFSKEELLRYIKQFSKLEYELKSSVTPRITLEATLFKLSEIEMDESIESLLVRIKALEQQVATGRFTVNTDITPEKVSAINTKELEKAPEGSPATLSLSESLKIQGQWADFVFSIREQPIWNIYKNSTVGILGEKLYLLYTSGEKEMMKTHLEELLFAAQTYFDLPLDLQIASNDEYALKLNSCNQLELILKAQQVIETLSETVIYNFNL